MREEPWREARVEQYGEAGDEIPLTVSKVVAEARDFGREEISAKICSVWFFSLESSIIWYGTVRRSKSYLFSSLTY